MQTKLFTIFDYVFVFFLYDDVRITYITFSDHDFSIIFKKSQVMNHDFVSTHPRRTQNSWDYDDRILILKVIRISKIMIFDINASFRFSNFSSKWIKMNEREIINIIISHIHQVNYTKDHIFHDSLSFRIVKLIWINRSDNYCTNDFWNL